MPDRTERSVLATPGANPRMIEKAVASAADLVILDLEDAVAPEQKPAARPHVVHALRELDWGGKPRAVRVNGLDTPYFYRDLIEVVEAAGDRLDLIVVPKANRPEDIYLVAMLLTQIETARALPRPIGLEIQIETAEGLLNCDRIAAASSRIEAIVFGPGDYAASVGLPLVAIGMADEWDAVYGGDRFHYPMHRILVAGRAAGLRVIDGPYADYRDADGFRRACLAARAQGYDGKWCIHPAQIAIANEVFTPTAAEIAWAERVLATYAAAEREGRGALSLDGKMIDAASLRLARATLARVRHGEPGGSGEGQGD
jgi:citrate lyase subunit beta/citryl-CoA lyase